MHGFFEKLGIKEPVFIGANDGGMVAQIYTQAYPKEVGGFILISTGGMDAETIKSLRKKYFLAPLMLFYMKHCNYEKLKPKLIKVGMGHSRNESKEELAYAKDMFETIFKDYTKEKDVHISGLLADLMKQTPVTETDFRMLKGKILLIDHFLATRCARKPFCFSIVSTVNPAFSAMATNSAGLCIFTSPCPNRLARGISR